MQKKKKPNQQDTPTWIKSGTQSGSIAVLGTTQKTQYGWVEFFSLYNLMYKDFT